MNRAFYLAFIAIGVVLFFLPVFSPLAVTSAGGAGCTSGVTITSLTTGQVSGVACAVTNSATQAGNSVYVWVTSGSTTVMPQVTATTTTGGYWSAQLNLGQGSYTIIASLCPQNKQPCSTQNAVASYTFVQGAAGSTNTFTETITTSLSCPTGTTEIAGACVIPATYACETTTGSYTLSTSSSGTCVYGPPANPNQYDSAIVEIAGVIMAAYGAIGFAVGGKRS